MKTTLSNELHQINCAIKHVTVVAREQSWKHGCLLALGFLRQSIVYLIAVRAVASAAVTWYFSHLRVDAFVRSHLASTRNARVSVCDSAREKWPPCVLGESLQQATSGDRCHDLETCWVLRVCDSLVVIIADGARYRQGVG